jgi:hypothetical protein
MSQLHCPSCSKEFVQRVGRHGAADYLKSLFYIYPFKCQVCGDRFSSFQWGVRYVRVKEDRREYERMPAELPVSMSGEEGLAAGGTVTEISMGGCTIKTDANLVPGDILTLRIKLSDELLPAMVDAAVVRNVRSNLVGVEFLKFQKGDRDLLQIFIRGLLASRLN